MSEFRAQIEEAADSFEASFSVTDIREKLGWENSVRIDSRIRYSLNRMDLEKKKVGFRFIYSKKAET